MLWLQRRFGVIMAFLDAISGVLLVICTASVFVNVIARYVFSKPFAWGEEVSVLSLVWMVYLSQGMLETTDGQLAMTVLYRAVGRQLRRLINGVRSLVTIAISLWLLVSGIGIVSRNYSLGVTTQALGFPFWIAYLVLPVGFICIAVARAVDPFVKVGEERPKEGDSN